VRVLILGSGGREHALAWKIARSPRVTHVLAAPGSDAIAREARCFPAVKAGDADAVIALARSEAVDLVVVGPEDPLVAGIADRLRDAGFAVFGPSRAAAQLEGSKSFAKEFMRRHAIPTAEFAVFDDLEAARTYVRKLEGPCVVKADGLAAGKGVAVCDDAAEAERALVEIMGARRFGASGARVVVEERLLGQEVSYHAISDGRSVVSLAAAQDHKRAQDGDRGENTGGMGAYSPAPVFTPAIEKRVLEEIVHPTIRGMAAEGQLFQGVLYVGLMIDAAGTPKVVEFNVRFGDPETQVLLLRLDGDLAALLDAAARGHLEGVAAPEWHGAAVCVALASGGYPRDYETGKPIAGLAEAASDPDVIVFHAGTRWIAADAASGDAGHFVTAGGRVLGVTARGTTVAEAQRRAYAACAKIAFEAMHLRRDIAARGAGA
jgi:phosphoribosylamine--glycine ligase